MDDLAGSGLMEFLLANTNGMKVSSPWKTVDCPVIYSAQYVDI